jgi:DNA polymerase I-like protein with 3'-5' exonuclease and polymerase domains
VVSIKVRTTMTNVFATYHPAFIKRDEPRAAPTFIADMKKAVAIMGGKPQDLSPPIQFQPTVKEVAQYLQDFNHTGFAFDLETTRGQPHKILTAAFANSDKAFVLDLSTPGAARRYVPIIRDGWPWGGPLVVQNAAFDIPLIIRDGWMTAQDFPWMSVFDTMLAGHILNPDDWVNLSHLCSLYLDVPAWKHQRESGDLLEYNALDAINTFSLFKAQKKELTERNQWDFFWLNIMPLLYQVVIPLQGRGIKLDGRKRRQLFAEWSKLHDSWHSDVETHFKELSVSFGRDIPPPLGKLGGLSNPQLKKVLYDHLQLPVQHHPKTRQPTVDKHALSKLETLDKTGTIQLLLRRSRLKENEVHLKAKADTDGRVRSRWVLGGDEKHRELTEKGTSRAKDKGPATGRAASREPNHQNIPLSAKEIYVPTLPDWWFVEGDSSNIEPRLTQYFSKDENLKGAIDSGDIYLYTLLLLDELSGLYGVHKEGWEALQARKAANDGHLVSLRQEAKRAFLGWSYRMGAKKLELTYGIPLASAKKIIGALNEAFFGVVRLWDTLEDQVRHYGYLENPYGRRRYFPIHDTPAICNFMAQSTAADILFESHRLLNVDYDSGIRPRGPVDPKSKTEHAVDNLLDRDVLGYFIATVHDSNLCEGPEWGPLAVYVKRVMEHPIQCMKNMVIPCNIKIGKNWKDLKEVKI